MSSPLSSEKETKKRYNSLALIYDLDELVALGMKQRYRKKILEKTCEKNPKTILDLTTGTGRMMKLGANFAQNVIGLDISRNMLKIASFRNRKKENTNFTLGNAAKLPFSDNSFEAITCSCGLDTVDRPKKVFSELERVLKPGGRLGMLYFSSEDGVLSLLDSFIKKLYSLIWTTQNINLKKEIKKSSLELVEDRSPPFATGVILEKTKE